MIFVTNTYPKETIILLRNPVMSISSFGNRWVLINSDSKAFNMALCTLAISSQPFKPILSGNYNELKYLVYILREKTEIFSPGWIRTLAANSPSSSSVIFNCAISTRQSKVHLISFFSVVSRSIRNWWGTIVSPIRIESLDKSMYRDNRHRATSKAPEKKNNEININFRPITGLCLDLAKA